MKKLLYILLFGLLLFNMMGLPLYSLLENAPAEARQYGESPELIVKVPMSLPYVTTWESSGDQEGELLHEACYYEITSKKISNDTLYLACRFDESARDRFWNLISSFDDHLEKPKDRQKNQAGSLMKNLLKEYLSAKKIFIFFIMEWATSRIHSSFEIKLLTGTSSVSTPPPNPAY